MTTIPPSAQMSNEEFASSSRLAQARLLSMEMRLMLRTYDMRLIRIAVEHACITPEQAEIISTQEAEDDGKNFE